MSRPHVLEAVAISDGSSLLQEEDNGSDDTCYAISTASNVSIEAQATQSHDIAKGWSILTVM